MENTNLKRFTLIITIRVEVESDLPINEVIDQFSSETDYNFTDTDDVKVIETEFIDIN